MKERGSEIGEEYKTETDEFQPKTLVKDGKTYILTAKKVRNDSAPVNGEVKADTQYIIYEYKLVEDVPNVPDNDEPKNPHNEDPKNPHNEDPKNPHNEDPKNPPSDDNITPRKPNTPNTPNTPNKPNKPDSNLPKTAVMSKSEFYMALVLVSVLGMVIVSTFKREKQK
ncbi:MAG: hypothetical protein PT934_06575 [Peptoniphilaceae bacterium]|nr:hypothetical protein [Peptoniphilaceae bacterium]